jgi:hypothetical protein
VGKERQVPQGILNGSATQVEMPNYIEKNTKNKKQGSQQCCGTPIISAPWGAEVGGVQS